MNYRPLLAVCLCSQLLSQSVSAKTRKAMYVIVDGVTQEMVEKVRPKNIFSVASVGSYAPAYCGGEVGGLTETATISAIGYTNILTGTWMNKHNVRGNSDIQTNYNYWNLFRIAKNQPREVRTALFSGWTDNRLQLIGEGKPEAGNIKIDYVYDGYDHDTINFPHKPASLEVFDYDSVVCRRAAECIRSEAPDLSWVYLWYSDDAFHFTGNSAFSERYLRKEDELIGQLWEAIQYREQYCDEEWLLIVTTDHGRDERGFDHGGQSASERAVWMVTNRTDMNREWGSENLSHVDINPSICRFLGLELPQEVAWEQEGIPFFGPADIYGLRTTGFGSQVKLTWQTFDASALSDDVTVDIFLSPTNDYATGGTDEWLKVGSTSASARSFVVDLSSYHDSRLYKFEVVAPGNRLTRWYKYVRPRVRVQ